MIQYIINSFEAWLGIMKTLWNYDPVTFFGLLGLGMYWNYAFMIQNKSFLEVATFGLIKLKQRKE